ncbi:fimbrial protein [Scandinavium sp. NPDC088450]|uniref:fimbrial protein n=1 Tax=Scandinavium sp. NPDC088450 TaxID=3364514 RepID=UPI00384CA5A3
MNRRPWNMTRLMMAVLLTAGLAVSGNNQASQNVTVTFTAVLLPGTCDVSVDGQGPDATVVLPAVTADDLNATGTAGKTAFKLQFSNCFGTKASVRAFFESGTGTNSSGYVINKGGTARNVDFKLIRDNGYPLFPDDFNQSSYLPIGDVNSTAEQIYYVAYVTDGKNATGGTVKGSITYRLDYK